MIRWLLYGDWQDTSHLLTNVNSATAVPPSPRSSCALFVPGMKPDPNTRRAAVLVALFGSRTGKNLNVLLSTRSLSLRTFVSAMPPQRLVRLEEAEGQTPVQPGNVALPGGKQDPEGVSRYMCVSMKNLLNGPSTDINLEATARREGGLHEASLALPGPDLAH